MENRYPRLPVHPGCRLQVIGAGPGFDTTTDASSSCARKYRSTSALNLLDGDTYSAPVVERGCASVASAESAPCCALRPHPGSRSRRRRAARAPARAREWVAGHRSRATSAQSACASSTRACGKYGCIANEGAVGGPRGAIARMCVGRDVVVTRLAGREALDWKGARACHTSTTNGRHRFVLDIHTRSCWVIAEHGRLRSKTWDGDPPRSTKRPCRQRHRRPHLRIPLRDRRARDQDSQRGSRTSGRWEGPPAANHI
jgi:hypothetical protein